MITVAAVMVTALAMGYPIHRLLLENDRLRKQHAQQTERADTLAYLLAKRGKPSLRLVRGERA